MSRLLWRVLRKNVSAGQLLGYAVANFVGLAIAVCALQFWRDIDAANSGHGASDMFSASEFVTLSRRPSALGSLLGGKKGFSQADIANLQAQGWVKRVAAFTPARFDVTATVDFAGRGFSTALFFEAIPDDFFDHLPPRWTFDSVASSGEIPIILPRDYLALYNFGFAPSRGLPQLNEGLLSQIPLRVSVSGRGSQATFQGRIAGFSSRVNTIAVPQAFLDYANARFGDPSACELPSRLMVEVGDAGNPAIAPYLSSHNLEMGGSNGVGEKMTSTLRLLTMVVLSVGVLIAALALFILLLSVNLIIQKNKGKIADLLLLGYSPEAIAGGYARMVAIVNIAVLAGVCGAVCLLAVPFHKALQPLGYVGASVWPSLLAAVGVMALLTLLNFALLRRYCSR